MSEPLCGIQYPNGKVMCAGEKRGDAVRALVNFSGGAAASMGPLKLVRLIAIWEPFDIRNDPDWPPESGWGSR
jgi:hypothetical protein